MPADSGNLDDRSYAFGPFRLAPARQALWRHGMPVRIGGRALELLTVLVQRAGEVIDKRELIARVWPSQFVDEGNLKVTVAALRRALGDDQAMPAYIATTIGRGYRFIAEVEIVTVTEPRGGPDRRRETNLQAPATHIVGRDDQIGAIQADLGAARLVSVVGPGGIGKTTVALAVAQSRLGLFDHGVWFVDLSALSDSALVANAIGTAIGVGGHSAKPVEALSEHLRHRQMLLVLDNCEHVIEWVASTARRMLADAPGLRMALDDRFAAHRSARDELLLNLTLGATMLQSRGPLVIVKASLERALAIAEQLGDAPLQLECLRGLSEYEMWSGDYRSAMLVADRIRALQARGQKAAVQTCDERARWSLHGLRFRQEVAGAGCSGASGRTRSARLWGWRSLVAGRRSNQSRRAAASVMKAATSSGCDSITA